MSLLSLIRHQHVRSGLYLIYTLGMTYGRSLLSLWPLDPDATYLNHGTVGVTPRAVLERDTRRR